MPKLHNRKLTSGECRKIAEERVFCVQSRDLNLEMAESVENGEMRTLFICTFTDHIQVLEPTASDVGALKTRLHIEQSFQDRPCFIREDEGVEVEDCELVGDLPEGARLICITSHRVSIMEAKMAKLQSPGDQYQKYLRWLGAVAADDPRILQTVWAVSILHQSARPNFNFNFASDAGDENCAVAEEGLDQVSIAVLFAVYAIWQKYAKDGAIHECADMELQRNVPVTSSLVKNFEKMSWSCLQHVLSPHYGVGAHANLLKSIVGQGGASAVLRTLLAEVEQILCRGLAGLVKCNIDKLKLSGHSRQTGAYGSLLNLVCMPADQASKMEEVD